MTTWKPGDVAMVTRRATRKRGRSTDRAVLDADHVWVFADGDRAHKSRTLDVIDDVRPLVVIDPESAEDVERLADLYWGAFHNIRGHPNAETRHITGLAAALREFAAPTPPKCPTLALQAKNAECSFDPGHDGWHTDTGMGVSWA